MSWPTSEAKKPVLVKQDEAQCALVPVGYDFQVFFKYGTRTDGKTRRAEWVIRNSGPLGASCYVIPCSRSDGPWTSSVEGTKVARTTGRALRGSAMPRSPMAVMPMPSTARMVIYSSSQAMPWIPVRMQLPNVVDVKSLNDGATVQIAYRRMADSRWRVEAGQRLYRR